MVLCFAASVESSAYTGSDYSFTKNGLYYKIIDGQNVRLVPGLQEPTGDVTVPYRVTNNSTTYYVSELDAKTFQNLSGLTSVTFSTDLPSTLTSIGISAFYNTAITRIVIPTGCTVGWGAFYNCDAIVHLTTNDKITKFDDCFGNLPNIQNLNLASGITSIPEGWFMNHTALKEVQFASDTHMTELPKNLFKGCTGLTKVTLPYTVTTIGQNAFSGCTSLTSINLDVATWLRTIPSQCFYGCSAMTAFSVPDFVTTVGSKAFGNMTALAEVSLGKGLTAATLATDAFDGSNNITKLTLDCNDIVSQYRHPKQQSDSRLRKYRLKERPSQAAKIWRTLSCPLLLRPSAKTPSATSMTCKALHAKAVLPQRSLTTVMDSRLSTSQVEAHSRRSSSFAPASRRHTRQLAGPQTCSPAASMATCST